MGDILIDFGRTKGNLKRIHGVNNGPVGYGSLIDVSHRFKEIGVPIVRLHDPNWPHPREVDIPQVFPDFEADPNDPKNYQFDRTDSYIRSILDVDAEIVYRLGVSIEHTEKKYYTHPPKDYNKWAAICVGIIKHYNYGWANGFHYGIKYWEIWNEPDNLSGDCMWSGTPEQFFELYKVASTTIKAFDPNLKVGGYGATQDNNEFKVNFLTFCKKYGVPLDFFSWHTYAASPNEIFSNAKRVRKMLDDYGFYETESHLNEWNLRWNLPWNELWKRGNEYARREDLERLKRERGASFVASVLMLLQDSPVDVANYYDGQPSALLCGLFDYYGVPQKPFWAFKAFNELFSYGERVESNITENDNELYSLAVLDRSGGKAAIFISNFSDRAKDCGLIIKNFPVLSADKSFSVEVHSLDKDRDLTLISSDKIDSVGKKIDIRCREYSVLLIKLS